MNIMEWVLIVLLMIEVAGLSDKVTKMKRELDILKSGNIEDLEKEDVANMEQSLIANINKKCTVYFNGGLHSITGTIVSVENGCFSVDDGKAVTTHRISRVDWLSVKKQQ